MANEPPYQFMHLYGCEPYEANGVAPNEYFGGGAQITNNNLLVTAWTVTDLDQTSFEGELLKPVTAFPEWSDLPGGTPPILGATSVSALQPFTSRTACRFYFRPDDPIAEWPLLLFLNPPAELKSLWANLFSFSNGTVTINKSAAYWPWNVYGAGVELDLEEGEGVEEVEGPIPYFTAFGAAVGELGLSRTSGADGQPPEFLPVEPENMTLAQIRELSKVLNTGNYFIPVLIAPTTGPSERVAFTIEWPHSIGRGG